MREEFLFCKINTRIVERVPLLYLQLADVTKHLTPFQIKGGTSKFIVHDTIRVPFGSF